MVLGPSPTVERASGVSTAVARVRAVLRTEARVFARTFFVTWLAMSVLFVVVVLATGTKPSGLLDLALGLAYGFVLGLVNLFWPALVIAFGRLAYRAVGWAAFVPLPLIVLGAGASFYVLRGWLGGLGVAYLRALTPLGPCGAHAGPFALICLLLATVTSAAALWALFKLVLGLAATLVVGALPGTTLWVVLVVRAIVRRVRSASAPGGTLAS